MRLYCKIQFGSFLGILLVVFASIGVCRSVLPSQSVADPVEVDGDHTQRRQSNP
jgi:hypothetical protein